MKRLLATASLALTSIDPTGLTARAATPPAVKPWRLDCGSFTSPKSSFSDLFPPPLAMFWPT